MFCPVCGVEDRTRTQYCRGCGGELRSIRATVEQGGSLAGPALSARDEIGRAIAAKIEEVHHANDLKKIVDHVLPQIEKFLESPAERRQRHIRGGVITSFVGLSLVLFFLLLAVLTRTPEVLIAGGSGVLVLVIGLGIVVSALVTGPRPKHPREGHSKASLNTGEELHAYLQPVSPSVRTAGAASVTEGTTRQLSNDVDNH